MSFRDMPTGRVIRPDSLRGEGPGSVIQGTTYGPTDGSNPIEIAKTEGWESLNLNQWDINNPNNVETVLQPVVRDISILGFDDVDNDYGDTDGTAVHSFPNNNPIFPFGDAIKFNGTSSPSGGTSKLVDSTANVLDNSPMVTVCCWINPDGFGEGSNGYVFVLDAADGNKSFVIRHASTAHTLEIEKKPGTSGTAGKWTIPIIDGAWNGVCIRLHFDGDYPPTARVNFRPVTVTEVIAPVGIGDLPAEGYCVGNRDASDRTWQGRIAQLQVIEKILTDAQADSALIAPGSVTQDDGLRLWLPMTNASDTQDDSPHGFNGTGTDLSTGTNFHDREMGLAIRASGPVVKDIGFFHIAGTACEVRRGGGVLNGAIQPFDREYATLSDLTVYRAYRGFLIGTLDTEVGNLEGQYLRDWGVKVPAGIGGVKFEGAVHISGVSNGFAAPASYGTAVWFEFGAGPCFGSAGGAWYCETSDIGMRIDSSGNKIANLYSHSCKYRNLWLDFAATRNSVSNFEILVEDAVTETYGGEGVLIAGQANMLSNGTITGEAPNVRVPSGEIAVRITNGVRQTIRDVDFIGTVASSAPLIAVECNGLAPFKDCVIVAKCVNAGTFLDLHRLYTSGRAGGGSSTTIQLAPAQVFKEDELFGMWVTITGGTGSSPPQSPRLVTSSTGSTATVSPAWGTAPTNDTTYEIKTGIDTGNYIWLTTEGTVTKAVNLPPEWDDDANEIWVDGVRKLSGQ